MSLGPLSPQGPHGARGLARRKPYRSRAVAARPPGEVLERPLATHWNRPLAGPDASLRAVGAGGPFYWASMSSVTTDSVSGMPRSLARLSAMASSRRIRPATASLV